MIIPGGLRVFNSWRTQTKHEVHGIPGTSTTIHTSALTIPARHEWHLCYMTTRNWDKANPRNQDWCEEHHFYVHACGQPMPQNRFSMQIPSSLRPSPAATVNSKTIQTSMASPLRQAVKCKCCKVTLDIDSPSALRMVCYSKDYRGYYNTLNEQAKAKNNKANAPLDPWGG